MLRDSVEVRTTKPKLPPGCEERLEIEKERGRKRWGERREWGGERDTHLGFHIYNVQDIL